MSKPGDVYVKGEHHREPMGFRRVRARLEAHSVPVPYCGCVLWDGQVDRQGYGVFYLAAAERSLLGGATNARAHRAAWALANRPLERGESVLHSCDVPACVNPLHLRAGSHVANMREMRSRGRAATGQRQHLAKLTDEGVIEMRALHATGWSTPRLARRFGVRQSTAWSIVTRRTWRHL